MSNEQTECTGCSFDCQLYNQCYTGNNDGSCQNRNVVRNLISDGWNNN